MNEKISEQPGYRIECLSAVFVTCGVAEPE